LTKRLDLTIARFVSFFVMPAMLLGLGLPAWGGRDIEQEVSGLFVGHVVTLRNFYGGNNLLYGSVGQLLSRAEPGYYSRDGMVEIYSVKLSTEDVMIMRGKRVCLLLDPEKGELNNVWTGDQVEIRVQLGPKPLDLAAAISVLQRVFFTAQDDLALFVPPYWRNCLQQKLFRSDEHSPWECTVPDKRQVTDFTGKKISWDIPPPDNSPHNGMQMYRLKHRVAYLMEEGMVPPQLLSAPDPLFQWIQRRAKLLEMTIILSLDVGADGKPSDITVVSPVGMGMDDQAAEMVAKWHFRPGKCKDQPCAVHARVVFEITPLH
jgi:TonB family protein